GTVCVVGKMRDLILQLSKSSIYSTKPHQGYASESVAALFDYLFKVKGARRLYAWVEDYNYSSQKLCERLLMRREGCFKEFVSFENEEGKARYDDTYIYALLHKEWTK
ncbi:GNAT family N-acetyltransferase, partial [Klebsiella pneumoniae]|uniref:GNAT family N-acetyltransferase n=1 Tax=Klebsiella pneumoniae TaxID=573 RepID=UPI002159CC96